VLADRLELITKMLASVVYCNNPFHPILGREITYLKRRRRVNSLAPKTESPFIAILNGEPLLRAEWRKTCVGDGDALAFVTLPQGGGGGSNPLRIVLTIAVLVVASWAGGALAGAGVSGFGVAVAKAGIVLGGVALVNAVIPPPKVPTPKSARDIAAASPTYSLASQGNQARLGQAIPVIYGRHLIYPDFGAQPYTEFSGNEQFLYQLFVVGQGKYTIESIRIEDTSIASFPGVNTEVVQPGGAVTLFPTNVVTSVEVTGQEALTSVALGPFVVNASGTLINRIGIDIVEPKGSYFANDAGGLDARTVQWQVEARVIDNAGVPVGGFSILGVETVTAATTTPQRRSFGYDVAPGRYDVKFTRINAKDTSTRAGNDLNWIGLRGYMPGTQFYGNVTMLAVRMQATNSLSELSSRRINLIVTRKLRSWSTASGYSAEADSRSIAWAALDMLTNADYGAGLSDTRINLAQLEALNSVWTSRSDQFNAVFDGQMTLWEALTHVMRAGRSVPIIQGGIYHFVRDQLQTVPVAMFNSRNIIRNSFSIEYLMTTDETRDSAESEFFDEVTWKPKPVKAVLPGGTDLKPAKLPVFFGITGFNQGWRETMHAAAQNRYRRKIIRFSTEMDGFIPTFGDLIAISHDVPAWAQSGHVTGWVAGPQEVTTSEPLDFSAGGTHQIALNKRDGTPDGPFTATAGSSSTKAILATAPSFTPYTGEAEEKTRYVFGPATKYWQLARAIEIKPRDMETVEIVSINEDALVHSADGGTVPDQSINWSLPVPPTAPVVPVGSLFLVAGGTPDAATISASWGPAAGAAYYVVDHSVDGVAWTRIAEVTLTNHVLFAPIGLSHVRVAGFGRALGPFVSASITITGNSVAPSIPPTITGFTATSGLTSIFLEWIDPAYANASHYELFRNTVNVFGTATQLPSLLPPTTIWADAIGQTNQTRFYWIRIISKKGVAGAVAGPATATTGKIGNVDLNDLIVTAAKLADGSVSTLKLGDDSVTAQKLFTTQYGAALNLDPGFADPSAWELNGAIPPGFFVTGLTDGQVGTTALRSGSPNPDGTVYSGAQRIPIDTSKTSRVRAWVRSNSAADGSLWIGLAIFDAAGSGLTNQWVAAANRPASTGWFAYTGQATSADFVANARTMAPIVALNVQSSLGFMEIQDLRIEEAVPATLIAQLAVGTAHIADASITAAKVATAAIGTAAIQNLAVTNALIGNAAIDHVKIADGQIITTKIDNAAITTGKIANLAVTTAQIADANITTLKVAGQAITVPVTAFTAGEISVGGQTNIQSFVINSTGAPLFIMCTCGLRGSANNQSQVIEVFVVMDIRLVRSDGYVVLDWTPAMHLTVPKAKDEEIGSFSAFATTGAISTQTQAGGVWQYFFQARSNSAGPCFAANPSMIAIEAKR